MIWILGASVGINAILMLYVAFLRTGAKEISELNKENIELLNNLEGRLELLKNNQENMNIDNQELMQNCYKTNKENLDLKEQLLREEQTTDKVVQDLEQKLNETREQLKLEDEASCKIIKDLEDEIEKERALNQTYSGYVKYILNAPRAIRRRFINGECIDWYDENGVLRMKIKEEK